MTDRNREEREHAERFMLDGKNIEFIPEDQIEERMAEVKAEKADQIAEANTIADRISPSFLGFDDDFTITGTDEERAAKLAEFKKRQRVPLDMIDKMLEYGEITEAEAAHFRSEWD